MGSSSVRFSPNGERLFLLKATLLIVKCCAVKLKEVECGCLYLYSFTFNLEHYLRNANEPEFLELPALLVARLTKNRSLYAVLGLGWWYGMFANSLL
jgi:hypothetical protein